MRNGRVIPNCSEIDDKGGQSQMLSQVILQIAEMAADCADNSGQHIDVSVHAYMTRHQPLTSLTPPRSEEAKVPRKMREGLVMSRGS